MPSRVTILMYHFVRDLARSRFPAIKGLTVEAFRGQVAYLRRRYEIVTMEHVIHAADVGGQGLPPRAVLLTFDDGYSDHFRHVVPILDEVGVQGSFFPPACAVLDNRVLDVNKIQFVLAAVEDPAALLSSVLSAVDARRERFGLRSGAAYWASFDESSRYDSREVTFVKRLLQKILPEEPRAEIVDELFQRHVTADEAAFARELYVDLDQLRRMRRSGMFVGSHGHAHLWLNAIDRKAQEKEIDLGLDFLRRIDPQMERWAMCYPYGGYDASLVEVLRSRGCALGLTVEVEIADLARHDRLLLPRLDTNDLPHDPDARPASWTSKMEQET